MQVATEFFPEGDDLEFSLDVPGSESGQLFDMSLESTKDVESRVYTVNESCIVGYYTPGVPYCDSFGWGGYRGYPRRRGGAYPICVDRIPVYGTRNATYEELTETIDFGLIFSNESNAQAASFTGSKVEIKNKLVRAGVCY